ncbi:cytochrome c oxidase assembly protein COX15 isoform X1 [Asparagus officinalis]|uniref:cytochrome c oxidase assembly protein COX15 isoform X1 n=2 Tax=Asparagus officinalis TaxID=4686 RepID=UPI00098E4C7B|nr:cytochrome c oxidase assembly protein COX15 isoform X1 [Asparagus officinalis]
MSSSRLGAILLRRSKTLTLISELRGSRVSNDPSLLSSSRFVSTSCRLYREPSSSSFLSRYRSSLYGFKSFPKTLFGPPKRQMTTSAAIIGSAKSEITSSGLKMLVSGGTRAQKMVGIWLFGCAAWVFSMVVLGGITRLTRSGLSMTDWKFTGGLPPLTEEEWLLEFEKYQQSPEYKRVNKGMSLGDFKFIFWMEYAHRMWGRGLGLMFALPFSYFLAKGFITRQLGLRLSALFALGGGQGLIGWWMVKSGLEEPASEYVQPRVSPYRLATHLISAFVIYCGIFWTALSVVMPEPPNGSISWVNCAAKVRKMALPLSVLVGITAFSGAFVAGNDAGHAYNTFPKMGDSWIPDDIFSMEPLVRNFFENTSTVQLGHRILATTTLLSVGSLWLASRKIDMHPAVKSLIGSTLGMASMQVTLGISTLLYYVPVSLASAHQAGALTLLTLMLLLTHTVRKPSPTILKSLASSQKIKGKSKIVE